MGTGEILTIASIWIAIGAYAAGSVVLALSHQRRSWESAARLFWSTAVVALLVHVACAFQYHHAWSHAAAYRDTARQTKEMFDLDWGGGLYINYLLLVCWVVDVAWWWIGGLDSYHRRPKLLVIAWHLFLIFIIFNATVVFETGLKRWVGLVVCLGLCLAWSHIARNNSFWESSREI